MKTGLGQLPSACAIDGIGADARHHQHFEGERALMAAVLLDALSIFYKTMNARGHRRLLEFREVRLWIYGAGKDGPFSFENVCAVIGVHPDALRDSLKRGGRKTRKNGRYFRRVVAAPRASAA